MLLNRTKQIIGSVIFGGLVGAGIPIFLVVLYLIGEVVFNGSIEDHSKPQTYFIIAGGVTGLIAAIAAVIRSGTITQRTIAGLIATIALWAAANLIVAYSLLQSGENLAVIGIVVIFIMTIPSWALGAIAAYAAARNWERMSR